MERIEPDYVARVALTPNDPRFAEQWGMMKIRAGSPAGSTETSAWNVSMSSATTRIAILDCGVYDEGSSTFISPDGLPGHPDLRGKVTDNKNFTSALDADDFCNHGTHVAGIAGANTNNSVGVAGVGGQAKIINVKVLGDDGSGSSAWIINGILYAAGCDTDPCTARRADIINMSLGVAGPCPTSFQAAINKAWGQGLVIVAAAGNDGASGAITPANCTHVIGVAASDQNDAKATFSNFGAGVDVAAPGVGILSSNFVGGYSSFNGTSMASPHVAGLAALIWTTAHNSGNQAVVDRITCTANENALAGSTNGRIDAYAAVETGSCAPTISGLSPSEGVTTGGTVVTVTGTKFATAPGATTFRFGASPATAVTCASATTCSATSPAGTGTVHVTVTVGGATSATSAADEFTYLGAPTTLVTYEDTDSAVAFSGSWGSWADAGHSGGSAKYSNQTGAAVSLSFNGSAVTLTYMKQWNVGIATVAIDGVTVEQIDTYSPTQLFKQQKTYTTTTGAHTVSVTVSGNKNAASADSYVLFDNFIVAP